MTKKITYIILIAVGLCFAGSIMESQVDFIPPEVLEAAETGLAEFIPQIPLQDIENYGFLSPDEYALTELGEPFKLYTIPPKGIDALALSPGVDNVLKETDHWLVPVMVQGERRVMITVVHSNGIWEAVGLSGAWLAYELDSVYFGLENEIRVAGVIGDYRIKFVRIFQAASDFLLIQADGQEYFKPLRSAHISLGLPDDHLKHPVELFPALQIKVKENTRRLNR